MKWIGKRISCIDEKDKSTIVIYPEKIAWKNSLLLAWVTVWLLIGIYVCFQFTKGYTRDQKLVLVVFMSFWVYFAYRIGKATLWQFYGKELIRIDPISLTYKKSIAKYGKATSYFLENIHKFSVEDVKQTNLGFQYENSIWVVGGERLFFDSMGKVHRFGRKLNDQDAKLLFKYIAKRLDEKLKKK